jgi:hypothetical protein
VRNTSRNILAALGLIAGAHAAMAQTATRPVSPIAVVWDSNTTVVNGTVPLIVPPWVGGGTITSVTYYTNGSTPSFTASVKIGGTNVTGCGALSVSSATPTTTTCTAANTFTSSSSLTLTISGVSGTPNQALVQVNIATTTN